VLRSERKMRKSVFVRSSEPTVWRLWYASWCQPRINERVLVD
jgi:hypothetical protein